MPENPSFVPGPQFDGWLTGVEQIGYGGDYNPEQWPEEVWAEDVRLMNEAGVNLVSLGIFSWALLEPREGEFDFGWLDRVIGLLHGGRRPGAARHADGGPAGLAVRGPPGRPGGRPGRHADGSRRARPHGAHRARVPGGGPAHHHRAGRAVRQRTPPSSGWHVHNEYGAPVALDYSVHAQRAFRAWLRERYGSLDGLNAAWGTAFWGQHYADWEHVQVPAAAPTSVNPAQQLDFARFSDAALRACFVAERDAVREYSTAPVTTNFMAAQLPVHRPVRLGQGGRHRLERPLPGAANPRAHVGLALAADLTRSVAGGKPWLLLEHSTSAVNWQPRNVAKRPGELARNSFSHLGRGADAVMFFQWRASRSGAEKFHSAMLPHAGTGSRVWREVDGAGREPRAPDRAARLPRACRRRAAVGLRVVLGAGSRVPAQRGRTSHRERIDTYYDRLWRDGHTVDLVRPSQDLSGYKLVVAPASYLLTAEARRESHRVRRGRRHAAGQLLQRHRRRARRRAPGRLHGAAARRARRAGRGVPAAAGRRLAHRHLPGGGGGSRCRDHRHHACSPARSGPTTWCSPAPSPSAPTSTAPSRAARRSPATGTARGPAGTCRRSWTSRPWPRS